MFIQIKHPLAIGIILLIQAIITCLIRGLINKRFWFQYILFIVFVGEMLVLFIYITRLPLLSATQEYIVLNEWMAVNNELEGMWKEIIMT
jgi:hypothetical protein